MANRRKYEGVIIESPVVSIKKMVNALYNPYHKDLEVEVTNESVNLIGDSWSMSITGDQIILNGTVSEYYDYDRVCELRNSVGSIRGLWNIWKSLRK